MIAKGLDFPNVNLVGVINADTALHLPDFRAAEKTFQLVTQVAGRTGRGSEEGRVIVQTYCPDHPAILAASQHDYQRFATEELKLRRQFRYPPQCHSARMVIRGESEVKTAAFAESMRERLLQLQSPDDLRMLGPAPAPVAKLRTLYRYHLLVFADDGDVLRQRLRQLQESIKTPADLQWIIEIDPVNLL